MRFLQVVILPLGGSTEHQPSSATELAFWGFFVKMMPELGIGKCFEFIIRFFGIYFIYLFQFFFCPNSLEFGPATFRPRTWLQSEEAAAGWDVIKAPSDKLRSPAGFHWSAWSEQLITGYVIWIRTTTSNTHSVRSFILTLIESTNINVTHWY